MAMRLVILALDDDDDEQDKCDVTLVLEAEGQEGERSHPAPCNYPEFLCICGLDDEAGE